jgi:hypothetical protein
MPRAADSNGAVGPYITHEIWVPTHTAIHRRRPWTRITSKEAADQVKGAVNKTVGKVLGDSKLETGGKAEQAKQERGRRPEGTACGEENGVRRKSVGRRRPVQPKAGSAPKA